MQKHLLPAITIALGLSMITGCDQESTPRPRDRKSSGTAEHIDEDERAMAAKLKPVKDPVQEEIYAFRLATRKAYNNRRFDELEKAASEARETKAVFGNGSRKIVQFYGALECDGREPESMWRLHEQIHHDWIAAKPKSITAQVAYADFLTSYAWQARGNGYADTVTEEGARLFDERLQAARQGLEDARSLTDKDPQWWRVGMTVALGQGWNLGEYDALVAEAKRFDPTFWGYDLARANSLLPRWYGGPGDWEAYAEKAAARSDGLGAEVYARIVINLHGYHENIFRETKASWPKTRDGLKLMLKKYPTSLEILSSAAHLATLAQDREMAKVLFERIGDSYLPNAWPSSESFCHYRHWAQTGKW